MTNTILVMGGIYLLFGQAYADAKGIPYGGLLAVIGSVISVNGVVEAILAGLVTVAITLALQKVVSEK